MQRTRSLGRREILRGGLALAGLTALGSTRWTVPALAQSEELDLNQLCRIRR